MWNVSVPSTPYIYYTLFNDDFHLLYIHRQLNVDFTLPKPQNFITIYRCLLCGQLWQYICRRTIYFGLQELDLFTFTISPAVLMCLLWESMDIRICPLKYIPVLWSIFAQNTQRRTCVSRTLVMWCREYIINQNTERKQFNKTIRIYQMP